MQLIDTQRVYQSPSPVFLKCLTPDPSLRTPSTKPPAFQFFLCLTHLWIATCQVGGESSMPGWGERTACCPLSPQFPGPLHPGPQAINPRASCVGNSRLPLHTLQVQYAMLCLTQNPGCLFLATNTDARGNLSDEQEWAGAGTMVGAVIGRLWAWVAGLWFVVCGLWFRVCVLADYDIISSPALPPPPPPPLRPLLSP